MSATVKTCGCGRTFTAAEWFALPLVGITDEAPEDVAFVTELRNCPAPCGSTLGVLVSDLPDSNEEAA